MYLQLNYTSVRQETGFVHVFKQNGFSRTNLLHTFQLNYKNIPIIMGLCSNHFYENFFVTSWEEIT